MTKHGDYLAEMKFNKEEGKITQIRWTVINESNINKIPKNILLMLAKGDKRYFGRLDKSWKNKAYFFIDGGSLITPRVADAWSYIPTETYVDFPETPQELINAYEFMINRIRN